MLNYFLFYHKRAGEVNYSFFALHNSRVNQEDLLYNLSRHSHCAQPNMNYILPVSPSPSICPPSLFHSPAMQRSISPSQHRCRSTSQRRGCLSSSTSTSWSARSLQASGSVSRTSMMNECSVGTYFVVHSSAVSENIVFAPQFLLWQRAAVSVAVSS